MAAERQRVYDGGCKTDILQIRDLCKVNPSRLRRCHGFIQLSFLIQGCEFVVVVSSAQTYVGRKKAAVDRICVGVPPGEVKSNISAVHTPHVRESLISFLCR